MSIAVLTQVYEEMRRVAIAGSVVASGDFRLKKLIPPLEQAGAKSPVFAKAAEAIKAVVDSTEANSATALLELATLVNAVLYTQGETGLAGAMQPIETTDLGASTAQVSARVIKPLLEALSNTGSGRLELIKDAVERGAFRDLRLVKPALDAIDDGYGEIGDLIAEKVLPIYGKAILPELRAKYDPKGRGGHPRRLRLMHQLDPSGSRELVKQALDAGSKEVKIAAIECLGADPEDLSYLIEQSTAKAQDVRRAAFQALSTVDHADAVAVLRKAMTGKDLSLAAQALRTSRSPDVLASMISEINNELAGLPKIKEKKAAGEKIAQLRTLLECLSGRDDKDSQALILKLFSQRDELAKIKGEPASGSDLNATVVALLLNGPPALQMHLAQAHGVLAAEELSLSFHAARNCLPAAQVFENFSPYLTAKVDEKKKQRDPAFTKREALCTAIEGHYFIYWFRDDPNEKPLDPRWLDVAVGLKRLRLVRRLIRPGHPAANAFLKETFDETIKKKKVEDDCHEAVMAMVIAEHPDATDAFISALKKQGNDYRAYWLVRLIPELPKSAIPKLEELVPSIKDSLANELIGGIQQLRDKK